MTAKTVEPITFTVGIDHYTLELGFNAICNLEREFDQSILDFAQQMQSGTPRLYHVLALFHSLLGKHHPNLDRERATSLLEALGVEAAGDLIAAAMKQSPLLKPQRSGEAKKAA